MKERQNGEGQEQGKTTETRTGTSNTGARIVVVAGAIVDTGAEVIVVWRARTVTGVLEA